MHLQQGVLWVQADRMQDGRGQPFLRLLPGKVIGSGEPNLEKVIRISKYGTQSLDWPFVFRSSGSRRLTA